ncbi:MAG: homoserine O-succinyltransferase [Clostridiales bacterium]|jgi:homoserine O-succinyltransferase|nr:homoserine O-succinyltransferase [Clostridiales bacterium]
MPVKVPKNLPAIGFLEKENIFVINDERALAQEIRPLRIAILNLMPNKIATETQLLRHIANSPLQVEAVFLHTGSYRPKNTNDRHLESFYLPTDAVIGGRQKFDGLIVTGAPVEKLDFTSVAYWDELRSIMAWAEHNVYSSMYICWAAQAALYYRYGIGKTPRDKKIFGIFRNKVLEPNNPLVRGFNDTFLTPHSRYTEADTDKVFAEKDLDVLAVSDDAGLYLAASKDLRRVFVFGHGEYDAETLHLEYMRDLEKDPLTEPPKNYYLNGEVGVLPPVLWRAHESLLFSNWLNYCVYQNTPYDLENIR